MRYSATRDRESLIPMGSSSKNGSPRYQLLAPAGHSICLRRLSQCAWTTNGPILKYRQIFFCFVFVKLTTSWWRRWTMWRSAGEDNWNGIQPSMSHHDSPVSLVWFYEKLIVTKSASSKSNTFFFCRQSSYKCHWALQCRQRTCGVPIDNCFFIYQLCVSEVFNFLLLMIYC